MSASLQVVVLAHGNGVAAFQRHLRFWEALKAPILVVMPENDPVTTTHERLVCGEAVRAGAGSIQRWHTLFERLCKSSWDKCVLYEYDSFSLEARLPEGRGLHGNVMANVESPRFMAPRYPNPPWCVDRESFDAMVRVARAFPSIREGGEADRWLAAVAMLAGVPILDYEPQGFSRGTITERDLASARATIYNGAVHVHGVKQGYVLAALEQFYDECHPSELAGKLRVMS